MRNNKVVIETLRRVGYSAVEVDGKIRVARPLRQDPDIYDPQRSVDRKALEMLCKQADSRWYRSDEVSADAAAQTLLFQAAEDILCCGYDISLEIGWSESTAAVCLRDPVTNEYLFVEQLDDLRRATYLVESYLTLEDKAHAGEAARKYGAFIQMAPRDVPECMVGPELWW